MENFWKIIRILVGIFYVSFAGYCIFYSSMDIILAGCILFFGLYLVSFRSTEQLILYWSTIRDIDKYSVQWWKNTLVHKFTYYCCFICVLLGGYYFLKDYPGILYSGTIIIISYIMFMDICFFGGNVENAENEKDSLAKTLWRWRPLTLFCSTSFFAPYFFKYDTEFAFGQTLLMFHTAFGIKIVCIALVLYNLPEKPKRKRKKRRRRREINYF